MILTFLLQIGIVFGILFLSLAVGTVSLIVIIYLDLRLVKSMPPSFVAEFADLLDEGQTRMATQLAEEETEFLPRVLIAGIRQLPEGIEAARQRMLAESRKIWTEKQRTISNLAQIAVVAPVMGLVAMGSHMISARRVLGPEGDLPHGLALAIVVEDALPAWIVGVLISFVAIAFYMSFKKQLAWLCADVNAAAEDLLCRMDAVSRSICPDEQRLRRIV